jgi:hypothetical protein
MLLFLVLYVLKSIIILLLNGLCTSYMPVCCNSVLFVYMCNDHAIFRGEVLSISWNLVIMSSHLKHRKQTYAC